MGTILIIGVGAYFLYDWWIGQSATASTTGSTTPTTGSTSTTPTTGTSQTSVVPIGTAAPPYTTAVTNQTPPATVAAPAINVVDGLNPATSTYSQGTAAQNTYLVVWGTFPVSPPPSVQINGTPVPASAMVVTADSQSGAPGPSQMNINLNGLGQLGSNTLTITTAAGTVSATFQITAQASTSISCNTASWNAMASSLFAHAQGDAALVNGKMNGWQWDWHVVNQMGGTAVSGWDSATAGQQMDVCTYMGYRAQYNANTGLSGLGRMNIPMRFRRR